VPWIDRDSQEEVPVGHLSLREQAEESVWARGSPG